MPDLNRFTATYQLDTAIDAERAAAVIAGEQSSGTFVAIPGETAELKARSAARVEELVEAGEPTEGPLPGSTPGQALRRYRMTLSWPLDNVGPSLPNLVATIAGNLFELPQAAGLKILDIGLPDAFADAYPGPAFAVAGTRRLAGRADGPLIGTIIKPSVGLDPAADRRSRQRVVRGRHRFHQGRRIAGRRPALPVRCTRARRDGRGHARMQTASAAR